MRLDTSSCYLVLHSGSDTYSRQLKIVATLQDALSEWTSCSRVSPIWPISDLSSSRHKEHFKGSCRLTFLGPHQLALLTESVPVLLNKGLIGLWVSAGCFNIVLCTDVSPEGNSLSSEVTAYAEANQVAYEQWDLIDGILQDSRHHSLTGGDAHPILMELSGHHDTHDHPALLPTFQENLVATATTLARAAAVYPPIFADMVSVAQATQAIMEVYAAGHLSLFDMQSRLLSLNAALSRFSSQAFSGIPPIRETECHFWIHSLLGTGSANIALRNLVSAVQATLGEARIPERLESLHSLTINPPSLDDLTGDTAILSFDLLAKTSITVNPDDKVLPLITYFSGRDGFSSHLQTLSAPLATLAECNSRRSNLLTVTHEISHIFVQSALAVLAPTPNKQADMDLANKLLAPHFRANNFLDAARQLFLEAIVGIEQVERSEIFQPDITNELPEMLQRNRQEVQEILVHAFDFLYFHSGDPEYYVSSIWHSWCAIPGIAERVPEYLMRTLCAVSANLLDQPPDRRFPAALRETKALLTKIASEIDLESNYVQQALGYIEKLESQETHLALVEKQYHVRIYLVRVVKIFLFSDTLAANLFEDTHTISGSRRYASKRKLVYDTNPIGNFLSFLRAQLKQNPTEAESIWVLHCLAFDKP